MPAAPRGTADTDQEGERGMMEEGDKEEEASVGKGGRLCEGEVDESLSSDERSRPRDVQGERQGKDQ